MKPLNRNEGVAVFVSLGVIAYLFFSAPIMNFLSRNSAATNAQTAMNNAGFTAQDATVGNGAIAEPGDLVSAHYVGKLQNGQVFDSSLDRGQPIQFVLGSGQVIRGWDEGIVGMRAGGTRVLTISPEYGYGAQAVGPIPANSTLVFEVQLVGVEKKQ